MRRFVSAVAFALSTVAHAQARPTIASPPINSGVAADHAGTVTIVNWLGTVRVIGWDQDSVNVSGVVMSGLMNDSLLVTRTAERGVRVRRLLADLLGGANVSGGSGSAELIVRVPAHSHVVVDGHQTAIDISGVLGKLDLVANVDGAMHVSGTPAELDAYVGGSDMQLDVTTPYLRARTGSGRITWNGSSDDVSLNTVSGTITVRGGVVGRARFESTSGDIRFSGGLSHTASVAIDTHGGDVTATFPIGTEAEVLMNAAVMDGFGLHSTNNPDPAKRGSVVHHLGTNFEAVVQINSFKGRARATIDSTGSREKDAEPLSGYLKVEADGVINFETNRPAYVAVFEVQESALAQHFPEIAPQAERAVISGIVQPLAPVSAPRWAGPFPKWQSKILRTFVLIASTRPLALGARFDAHRLRYALQQKGHKTDLDLMSGMRALRELLAPGRLDSDVAMTWTTVQTPAR